MNSVQTVTLNSALSQNWVGCTVCTPRTQVTRTVPMSWALLRAQQACRACRARSQRRSRACWACTCRDTPRQPAPRSRPHFDVATSRQPESCRDIKSMSRHHSERSRSRPQNGVATPNLLSPIHPGRDVHFLSRPHADQTRSRPHADQTRSRPQVMSRPQIVFLRSQHEFHVTT